MRVSDLLLFATGIGTLSASPNPLIFCIFQVYIARNIKIHPEHVSFVNRKFSQMQTSLFPVDGFPLRCSLYQPPVVLRLAFLWSEVACSFYW